MKKFLLSLLMLITAVSVVKAEEITFDPNASTGWTGSQAEQSETKDGVTIHCSDGKATNGQYRFYKNSTATISVASGKITSIKFVCTANGTAQYGPGCFENSGEGTYSYDGKTGTWVGSASQVVLTAKTAQVRATSIVVTIAKEGAIAAPVISPKAGTYYETPIEVSITNPNSTGKVYYTLDGTEPTAASAEYAEAISITTNTTVKAVVIDGDKASEVVTAEYVIATPEEVANIAEYLAKEDGAVVKFTNPVTAVYQKGAYLYVVDDSGVALIYGSIGQTYDNGSVIPAGFYGTKTTYNGVVELKNEVGAGNSNASFLASTSSVDPINPTVATVADITKENMNKYFMIPNVTLDAAAKTITDAQGKSVAVFTTHAAIPADGEYDVIGFASMFKENVQFLPIEYVSKVSVDNVAAFRALEVGSIAKLNNPVTVVGVYETNKYYNYFVVDETAGITIYALKSDCPAYKVGDVIPGGFRGKLNEYNGNLQIEAVEDMKESETNAPATPTVYAIEEITADMAASFVRITDVTISDVNNRDITLNDATGAMSAWNRCDLTLPDAAATVTVDGVVYIYKSGETSTVRIIPVTISVTSEDENLQVGEKVEVIPGTGEITVNGADIVDVYDVDGKPRTTTVKGSGDTPKIIRVGEGMYIVVADGEAVKVIVD